MREEATERSSKWQPLLLIVRDGGRLECECGAQAVVVVGSTGKEYNQLEEVDHFCQQCYLNWRDQ